MIRRNLVGVVQRVDSDFHWINFYPVGKRLAIRPCLLTKNFSVWTLFDGV